VQVIPIGCESYLRALLELFFQPIADDTVVLAVKYYKYQLDLCGYREKELPQVCIASLGREVGIRR
jgi:hypothetical protein